MGRARPRQVGGGAPPGPARLDCLSHPRRAPRCRCSHRDLTSSSPRSMPISVEMSSSQASTIRPSVSLRTVILTTSRHLLSSSKPSLSTVPKRKPVRSRHDASVSVTRVSGPADGRPTSALIDSSLDGSWRLGGEHRASAPVEVRTDEYVVSGSPSPQPSGPESHVTSDEDSDENCGYHHRMIRPKASTVNVPSCGVT